MTCIAALVDNGITYFAADSFVGQPPETYYSRANQTIRKEPKIWVKDGMVFGGNGNTRMLQLLRYMHETPPYNANRQTKVEYLVREFVPSLQECFTKNKYPADELNGGVLLSIRGGLFTVGNRFEICDTADYYETVGQGGTVPTGSLHTTAQLGLPPLHRLYLALASAQQHTCVVEPPFIYITNEMSEPQSLDQPQLPQRKRR